MMSIPSPNLDDRDFRQLVNEARQRIIETCPGWTDLSPSDPGIVLLELFAHLTEVMIYRLNRLPHKAFIEFLRLIGVRLFPPCAASTVLKFSRSRPGDQILEIPRGTRVTLSRSGSGAPPPTFTTASTARLETGSSEVEVLAHHCDLIEAEAVATGTGLPGQSVSVLHPPIIAATGDELDLMVGVEAAESELAERERAVERDGKPFRIWREVENFTELGSDRYVYVADRLSGTIVFAPAARLKDDGRELAETAQALAEVPPVGRRILVWYRRGGGVEGNVAADTLTVLKDSIAGVQVTNPKPATGGRAAESLQNALVRGPQEFHSLHRAVTARDFELMALRASGSVARSKAVTRATLWVHAPPGTVEILLVPHLPEESRQQGRVSGPLLKQQESESERERVARILEERRPLGTTCVANWVRYKTVRVRARVVLHRGENGEAVKNRVLERLHRIINPLPSDTYSGWRFGYPLRASHVYDIILSEPGVSYADQVCLLVDEVPEQHVTALAQDRFQRFTWYAGSESRLFRTLDDADGWEVAATFENQHVERVRVHPNRPGLLAVATRLNEEQGSGLHVSHDCGETWKEVARTGFNVVDMEWMLREGQPVLLLATDVGLYELTMEPEAVPVQIVVAPKDPDLGFYAIAVSTDVQGMVSIAVAARAAGGVFLSAQGGKPGTFTKIGLEGEDVRVLEVQGVGPLRYLWAGLAVPGRESGKGCYRWELRAHQTPLQGSYFGNGWTGGSCWDIAFQGANMLAATDHAGVLILDPGSHEPAWKAPEVGCGLPLREVGRFESVRSVASDAEGRMILVGGGKGVYRSTDLGITYAACSRREFREKVTLPQTWLFCSGEHEIEVVEEHEAE